MATLKHNVCRLNSLRSRPVNQAVTDYDTFFSRLDMMTQRENYQKGDNNVGVYVDWINGKEIRMQLNADISSSSFVTAYIVNVNTGASTLLNFADITPVGRVGYDVYEMKYTPTTDGYYYIYYYFEQDDVFGDPEDTTDFYFYTDQFKVRSDNDTEKDLVSFQYRNSYNKFGVVFDDDYFNAFFTGLIEFGDTITENDITQEDDGISLDQSKSFGGVKFVLTEIHRTLIRQIERICQCDDLWINGNNVVVQSIEKERVENSDLYNVTINASLANNDYYNDYYGIY